MATTNTIIATVVHNAVESNGRTMYTVPTSSFGRVRLISEAGFPYIEGDEEKVKDMIEMSKKAIAAAFHKIPGFDPYLKTVADKFKDDEAKRNAVIDILWNKLLATSKVTLEPVAHTKGEVSADGYAYMDNCYTFNILSVEITDEVIMSKLNPLTDDDFAALADLGI